MKMYFLLKMVDFPLPAMLVDPRGYQKTGEKPKWMSFHLSSDPESPVSRHLVGSNVLTVYSLGPLEKPMEQN